MVSQNRSNLPKGFLVLQGNAAPHKVTITHQKLADLQSEVLEHPAYSLIFPFALLPLTNLKEHFKEESSRAVRPH
jgi:hypothetical protein